MSYVPSGRHLIAGNWTTGTTTFTSSPATGTAHTFAEGGVDDVAAAVQAAEDAFATYGYTSAAERAAFLRRAADEIDARGESITAIGTAETALPAARLEGERGRTTGQLRLFADLVERGAHLDKRHDEALPDRAPLPRPDLKLVQRPIGPVAVFGASNFPLAFSTAGGDTAAALAAGCPVVVKGHPAHPGTCEIVAEALHAAIEACDLHPGVFSLVQGSGFEAGQALVQHPLINAVGFTGSLRGGRALFDLCAQRPTPIPFFGELGSVNPMFVLPEALAARGESIATGWAGSLTMGAGQFCTNPGVAVVMGRDAAHAFATTTGTALGEVAAQTMLTDGIAAAYGSGVERIAANGAVEDVMRSASSGREASPNLFLTGADAWLANEDLAHEVFGPVGIVVAADDFDQVLAIARGLEGQLTCTLHMDAGDTDAARQLMPVLERKAGRLLANAFPTGVEVCDAMVHGGPYPASTNFGATSVGTLSIRRFVRPVCYQDIPEALLPEGLG